MNSTTALALDFLILLTFFFGFLWHDQPARRVEERSANEKKAPRT